MSELIPVEDEVYLAQGDPFEDELYMCREKDDLYEFERDAVQSMIPEMEEKYYG